MRRVTCWREVLAEHREEQVEAPVLVDVHDVGAGREDAGQQDRLRRAAAARRGPELVEDQLGPHLRERRDLGLRADDEKLARAVAVDVDEPRLGALERRLLTRGRDLEDRLGAGPEALSSEPSSANERVRARRSRAAAARRAASVSSDTSGNRARSLKSPRTPAARSRATGGRTRMRPRRLAERDPKPSAVGAIGSPTPSPSRSRRSRRTPADRRSGRAVGRAAA